MRRQKPLAYNNNGFDVHLLVRSPVVHRSVRTPALLRDAPAPYLAAGSTLRATASV